MVSIFVEPLKGTPHVVFPFFIELRTEAPLPPLPTVRFDGGEMVLVLFPLGSARVYGLGWPGTTCACWITILCGHPQICLVSGVSMYLRLMAFITSYARTVISVPFGRLSDTLHSLKPILPRLAMGFCGKCCFAAVVAPASVSSFGLGLVLTGGQTIDSSGSLLTLAY